MKITKQLKCSGEEFFDYLVISILKDLKSSVSKKIVKNDIQKGFTFKRKIIINNKAYPSHCLIKELEIAKRYHLCVDTGMAIMHIIHNIKEIDDQNIIDQYEEYLETKNLWLKFDEFKNSLDKKKAMRNTLDKFEVTIIGRRK